MLLLHGHDWSDWPVHLALPLTLLAVPMVLSVTSIGEWLLVAFPVALVIGVILRPPRIWSIWIGSVLLMWAVYGLAVLVGLEEKPASDPAAGETIWTFALESVIFMAALVLVPTWLGRLIARMGGTAA